MLQRSGPGLYSNCAGDKPRTCSATICVVISKCTRRCSRSSLVMGAANSGAANTQTINVRIVQSRSIHVRGVFIVKSMVVGALSEYSFWTIKGEECYHAPKRGIQTLKESALSM